jgi:hypothetical protein
MKIATRRWMLTLVGAFGLALVTSTTPTAAYSVVSSPQPVSRPSVGVLFSNSFTFYYYYHHHYGTPTRVEEPRIPEDFFDRK